MMTGNKKGPDFSARKKRKKKFLNFASQVDHCIQIVKVVPL